MTRVETYLNENLRKRLDQVEQVLNLKALETCHKSHNVALHTEYFFYNMMLV